MEKIKSLIINKYQERERIETTNIDNKKFC